jgi:hypothetical protein
MVRLPYSRGWGEAEWRSGTVQNELPFACGVDQFIEEDVEEADKPQNRLK